ncbi:MAG: murein hydrolase activator EnvC family protein [Tropicimonas sp.]|uniref:murein hydrolase activator EnvC family protein n=1 Tax=Tropicimonas sp. TaxID=2067044 RepID=UPI003A8BEC8D
MIRHAVLAVALVVGGAAGAETDPARLAERAAGQLQTAAHSLEQARGARDRVRALTATVRAYEEGLAALRAGMRLAARREHALAADLAARDEEISRLLGALAAMNRAPGPLLLLHPDGPLATARAGMIVSEMTPALEAEAGALRAELRELAILRALQQSTGETLRDGLLGAQEARSALSLAMAARTDLPRSYSADPDRMQHLLDSSQTLDGFARSLIALGPAIAPPTAFAERKGALTLPVRGTVLRSFGEADAAGIRRPGLIVATLPGALVSAPAEGTIRYVGPLLDYGNVMILEPADGFLLVFAGMGTVYGENGEVVREGAALGVMGGEAEAGFPGETHLGTGADLSETLYMELRQGETPVDPAAWFASTRKE